MMIQNVSLYYKVTNWFFSLCNLTLLKTFTFYVDKVQQLDDQENIGNVGATDNIPRRFKMPKRINHKGETMLHVFAIKVNTKIVLCNI